MEIKREKIGEETYTIKEQHIFILKKDIGKFKAGHEFDCMGGSVHGVHFPGEDKVIPFTDKEYFRYEYRSEQITETKTRISKMEGE